MKNAQYDKIRTVRISIYFNNLLISYIKSMSGIRIKYPYYTEYQ